MNIIEQAEIHFHQQEQLSVYLESNSAGNVEKAGEIGLLTMFALRMMSNLDVCETTDNLAKFLIGATSAVPAFALGKATGGFQLIPYPGHAGRKQFSLKFRLTASQLRFDLDYKGFGWFAIGMGYYGPIAVIGLLRQLAVKRADDLDFLEGLASAAVLCGQAQLGRKIRLQNQSELGLSFLTLVCGEYFITQLDVPEGPDSGYVALKQASEAVAPRVQENHTDQTTVAANAECTDGELDFAWPKEIGNTRDDKFRAFGQEFNDTLGRTNGVHLARVLYGFLYQDEQVWFYERVWPYFRSVPLEKWPQDESSNAELWCRRAIGFFQAFRSRAVACNQGWIAAEKGEWYLDWLLRLIVGEHELQRGIYGGKLAAQFWLPRYEALAGPPWVVLSSTLAAFMEPSSHETLPAHLSYVLCLFAPTIDNRAEATTAFAFGEESLAREKRRDAVLRERALGEGVEQLATGGGICHVLETDDGILVSTAKDGARVLHIWTEERAAQSVNNTRLGGTHRVTPMDYRELECQLKGMLSRGSCYVIVDKGAIEHSSLVPGDQFLAHLRQTIAAVDELPIVKLMRSGIEDIERSRLRCKG